MGKEPLFYEPADKILFLVPKKQVFGWWSDVYLVVDQSKFVDLVREIISEQSDEVDISKKTRLGSLIPIHHTIQIQTKPDLNIPNQTFLNLA